MDIFICTLQLYLILVGLCLDSYPGAPRVLCHPCLTFGKQNKDDMTSGERPDRNPNVA